MHPRDRAQRWSWLAAQSEPLRRALSRRLSPEEADDAAQEAVLRTATSAAVIPSGPGARRWLWRVARNISIDRWRRREREVRIDLAAHVRALGDTAAERIDLEAALTELSRADQRVLAQVAAGMRYEEIARADGVAAATVRKRVARARARLLALLREGSR